MAGFAKMAVSAKRVFGTFRSDRYFMRNSGSDTLWPAMKYPIITFSKRLKPNSEMAFKPNGCLRAKAVGGERGPFDCRPRPEAAAGPNLP